MKNLAPETVAAQAGGGIDEATGAIVPPLHMATTFIRDPDNQYRKGYSYGRPDNATVRQAEAVLTALEGGAAGLVLASGMSAATATFLALERPAHVVAPKVMYWGLRKWLAEDAPALGIEASFVDAADPAAIRAGVRPGKTRLVWIETPANPLWTITDIAETAAIAHAAGALLAVDSTVPTPVLTQPIALGADIVMHSGTKYLNGHSDVIAGALVFARKDATWERAARAAQHARRDPRAVRGVAAAARHAHPARARAPPVRRAPWRWRSTSRVILGSRPCSIRGSPLIPDTQPRHGRCTAGFGGMLSIRVKGGEAAAIAAAANVQDLEAGHVARRRREPDRASRQRRGTRLAVPARPAAALGRPREPRRPDRRPRAGDRGGVTRLGFELQPRRGRSRG